MDYELVRSVNAAAITRFHDAALCPAGSPCAPPRAPFAAVWQKIEEDHRCNALLWTEEDKARRIAIGDARLAVCRCRIDGYNLERSAAIAAIDECLLKAVAGVPRHARARFCSETAGAMIDALSVLSIRIHHMRLYTEARPFDRVPVPHRLSGLAALVAQRIDLACRLDELIAGAVLGIAYFAACRTHRDDGGLERHFSPRHGGVAA